MYLSLKSSWRWVKENSFLVGIILYLSFACILRFVMSGALEGDQAEQLLASQNLALGYQVQPGVAQPPLYTYLVSLMLIVFQGNARLALLFVRLSALIGAAFAFDSLCNYFSLTSNRKLVAISTAALMPQLIWEAQRDLTHTLLGIGLTLLLLLRFLRLHSGSHLNSYLFVGFIAGLGILSKHTLFVAFASLLSSSLFFKSRRRCLFNWKMACAIGLCFLVVLPHLTWMYNIHLADAEALLSKIDPSAKSGIYKQFSKSIVSVVSSLGVGLLAIVWLLLCYIRDYCKNDSNVPQGISRQSSQPRELDAIFLSNAIMIGLVLFIGFILLAGGASFKDRWLTLLLVGVPVLVGFYWKDEWRLISKAYIISGVFCALLALAALALRPFVIPPSNKPLLIHLPIKMIAKTIKETSPKPSVIVSSSIALGGNLYAEFPGTPVHQRFKSKLLVHTRFSELVGSNQILIVEQDMKMLKKTIRAANRFFGCAQHPSKTSIKTRKFVSSLNPEILITIHWAVLDSVNYC